MATSRNRVGWTHTSISWMEINRCVGGASIPYAIRNEMMKLVCCELASLKILEFECHLDLQAESSDYVATIEWRMNIQIKQNKPHMKHKSIAHEFTISSS